MKLHSPIRKNLMLLIDHSLATCHFPITLFLGHPVLTLSFNMFHEYNYHTSAHTHFLTTKRWLLPLIGDVRLNVNDMLQSTITTTIILSTLLWPWYLYIYARGGGLVRIFYDLFATVLGLYKG